MKRLLIIFVMFVAFMEIVFHLGMTSAPFPEPVTMVLLGVGLCELAFVGRKRLNRH